MLTYGGNLQAISTLLLIPPLHRQKGMIITMEFGTVLAMLRKNRGLTQTELADGITTRRAISEIEHGKQNITYLDMIRIIERLGVSVTDFEDYRNDHQLPPDQALIVDFEHLSDTSQSEQIKLLLRRAEKLNETSQLRYVHQLIPILNALLHIDCIQQEQLTQLVKPVWNELCVLKEWNRTDLFIINNLLYIFDPQTAQKIGKKVIKRLEHYAPDDLLLKNAIYVNLGYLGMKHPDTLSKKTIVQYLTTSIKIAKDAHRYDLHLLSRIRLAVFECKYAEARKLCHLLELIGADNIARIAYGDFPILCN